MSGDSIATASVEAVLGTQDRSDGAQENVDETQDQSQGKEEEVKMGPQDRSDGSQENVDGAQDQSQGKVDEAKAAELRGPVVQQVFDELKKRGIYRIFVDGSCDKNGQVDATSGYGVHFERNPERDFFAAIPGTAHTNNIAELMAIHAAVQAAPTGWNEVQILSDSQYARNAVMNGVHKWIRDFKTGKVTEQQFKSRANIGLIMSIKAMLDMREDIQVYWVKGHSDWSDGDDVKNMLVAGNTNAHELANLGRKLQEKMLVKFGDTVGGLLRRKRKKRCFDPDELQFGRVKPIVKLDQTKL
jgi:ribonuclease HI